MKTAEFKELVAAIDEDIHPFIKLNCEPLDTDCDTIEIEPNNFYGHVLDVVVPAHMCEENR